MLERSGVTSPIDDLQFITKLSQGNEYKESLKGWENSCFGKALNQDYLFLCDVRTQTAKNLIGVLEINRDKVGIGELHFYYYRNTKLYGLASPLPQLLVNTNYGVLDTGEDFYVRMKQVFGFPFLTRTDNFELSSSGVEENYSVSFWRRNHEEWRLKPGIEITPEVSAEAFKRAFLQTFPSYRITPHTLA